MKSFFSSIPLLVFIALCLTLGLSPFVPQPHVIEKLPILLRGELTKMIEIFDLLLHVLPFVLLLIKSYFLLTDRQK